MDTEIWILHKFCVTNHILLLILFQPFTKVKIILGSGPSWNRNQAGHVPRAVVAKPCSGILCSTQALTFLQGGHLVRRPAHRLQFSSVAQSCPTLWSHGLQHARLPCPSPSPEACSNSCPLSRWCHPTISTSVVPFSSCLQSFPVSESFPFYFYFLDVYGNFIHNVKIWKQLSKWVDK